MPVLVDTFIYLQTLTFVLYKPSVFWEGWGSEDTRRLMEERCDQAPFAERVRGRLFFFRHHDGLLDQARPEILSGRRALLHQAKVALSADPHLYFAVALDREENCRAFHGRDVRLGAGLVGELRELGAVVLDPNPAFAAACQQRELYLPDGHWNEAGHELFARATEPLIRRLLEDAEASDSAVRSRLARRFFGELGPLRRSRRHPRITREWRPSR